MTFKKYIDKGVEHLICDVIVRHCINIVAPAILLDDTNFVHSVSI